MGLEDFKKDIFKQENPFHDMFSISQLDSVAIKEIRYRLCGRLGCDDHELQKRLFVLRKDSLVARSNLDKSFSIDDIFTAYKIHPDKILINWDDFKTVDELSFQDFCKWFRYIWYPSSDDMDVFSTDLTWMLHVSHFEVLSLTRLADSLRLKGKSA
jgi:hypothetical protein